jgi:hypothetical protein
MASFSQHSGAENHRTAPQRGNEHTDHTSNGCGQTVPNVG